MRELRWTLWKMRWYFLIILGMSTFIGWVIWDVTGNCNFFELGFRGAFVMLQLIFLVLQRDRVNIVLRKERSHCFYRSMPNAWRKEKQRFLWMDGFCMACLGVLFLVAVVFQNKFSGNCFPTLFFIMFFYYVLLSRVMAAVPYVWWIQDLVFAALWLFVPLEEVPAGFGIVTMIGFVGIQVLLYRYIKKLWYTQE